MPMARTAMFFIFPLGAVGCATLYEGKFDYADGWRQGIEFRLDLDALPDHPSVNCRKNLLVNDLGNFRFALVHTTGHRGRARRAIAVAGVEAALQVGDHVYRQTARSPVPASPPHPS